MNKYAVIIGEAPEDYRMKKCMIFSVLTTAVKKSGLM